MFLLLKVTGGDSLVLWNLWVQSQVNQKYMLIQLRGRTDDYKLKKFQRRTPNIRSKGMRISWLYESNKVLHLTSHDMEIENRTDVQKDTVLFSISISPHIRKAVEYSELKDMIKTTKMKKLVFILLYI